MALVMSFTPSLIMPLYVASPHVDTEGKPEKEFQSL